jgi:ketosteroid isomerase-like protein
MAQDSSIQERNKALVQASFDNWRSGTGGPFDLLAPNAAWTIVGSSPVSATYCSTREFLDKVLHPFNARMATPLVPSVRGIYADGDMVIILFDGAATATDGVPYRNTYTWYFQIRGTKIVNAIEFFDTRDFEEFWMRVKPQHSSRE